MENNEQKEGKKDRRQINRKLNSLLFILGATVANVAIMIGMIVLLLFVYARFLASYFPEGSGQVIIILFFFIAVAASYLFYHLFIKWLSKKVDMEKYFDPIFRFGGRK